MSDDQFCTATASGGFKSPGVFRSPVPPPCLVMGGCEDLKHERGVLAAVQEERANLIKECQAKQAIVNEQYSQIANQMETIKELQGVAERATNEATSLRHLKTEKEVMLGRIANQSSRITALEEVRRKDRSTYEASIQGVKAEKAEWRKKCDRLTAELAGRLNEAATVKELKEERGELNNTIGDYQISAMAKAKRIQKLKEDLKAHGQAYDQAVSLLDLEKSKNQTQVEIIKELEKERDAARVESRNVRSSWKLALDQRDAKEQEIKNLARESATIGNAVAAEWNHEVRRLSDLLAGSRKGAAATEAEIRTLKKALAEAEGSASQADGLRWSLGWLNQALAELRAELSETQKAAEQKDALIGKLKEKLDFRESANANNLTKTEDIIEAFAESVQDGLDGLTEKLGRLVNGCAEE